jgi:hypothetical protein
MQGEKSREPIVLQSRDYLDRAEAAAKTGQPSPPAPFMWRLYRMWKAWGVSPLELTKWPTELVEGFQACDIVELQRSPACAWAGSLAPAQARTGGTGRNVPVEVGDAS